MKHLLWTLAVAGATLGVADSGAVYAAPQTAVNPTVSAPATTGAAANSVIAQVNGEKIMAVELNRRVEAKKADDPALQGGTPAATQALAQVRGEMLDDLITLKLLGQEARNRKIVTPPKTVDDSVVELKKGFKDPADFNKWLGEGGVTEKDVRASIADELAINELVAQVTSDATVTDADIATFYRAHPEEFTIPPAVKARHILLAINPSASAADKDAVKKRAQALIKQLKGGADFAALAKANSDDQSNKDRGGDLGAFERGMMVKPFEDAAFGAKAGSIVGPVETQFGIHIIKVDEVIPEKVVELKDVKDDPRLKLVLLRQKKQDKFDSFLAGLKASAKISKTG